MSHIASASYKGQNRNISHGSLLGSFCVTGDLICNLKKWFLLCKTNKKHNIPLTRFTTAYFFFAVLVEIPSLQAPQVLLLHQQ